VNTPLRWIAAHTAGFGGLLVAAGMWLTGHKNEALVALVAACGSFGVNLPIEPATDAPK
jgi:hypothetical protein